MMMRFNLPPEPSKFNQKVRPRGNAWLAENLDPAKRLPNYWSAFKPYLADSSGNLCGYSTMYEWHRKIKHKGEALIAS